MLYPGFETNKSRGLMNASELNFLYQLAKKANSIVEIGSWQGCSTHALLTACKGIVYAVDHWKGSPNPEDATYNNTDDNTYRIFLNNVSHFSNLIIKKMSSIEAAKDIQEVDMVWIDGCHLYESVLEDITIWNPKAKKIICGHDINWESVQKAVKEIFSRKYFQHETIWVVEKK